MRTRRPCLWIRTLCDGPGKPWLRLGASARGRIGYRVLGFRIWGLEFRVLGSGVFRAQGLGFIV